MKAGHLKKLNRGENQTIMLSWLGGPFARSKDGLPKTKKRGENPLMVFTSAMERVGKAALYPLYWLGETLCIPIWLIEDGVEGLGRHYAYRNESKDTTRNRRDCR
jgi:hypothetical protein